MSSLSSDYLSLPESSTVLERAQTTSLTGKSIVITGGEYSLRSFTRDQLMSLIGTHGLGRATLLELASRQPRSICFTGRDAEAALEVKEQISVINRNIDVTFIRTEHADLRFIQASCKQITVQLDRLDILVLNAGVMGRDAALTKDGYEWHFGINHLAHALMVKLLMPLLNTTSETHGDARVVTVSSSFRWLPQQGIVFETLTTKQDWWYGGRWMRYAQSKLANAAYATTIAEKEAGISCISVHPGVVATGLWDHKLSLANRLLTFAADVTQAGPIGPAITVMCWAATTPKENLKAGAFYERPGESRVHSPFAADVLLRSRLWNWTQLQLDSWG